MEELIKGKGRKVLSYDFYSRHEILQTRRSGRGPDVKGDFKPNRKHNNEAGEINQKLRPLAFRAEDLGSGSSSHRVACKIL